MPLVLKSSVFRLVSKSFCFIKLSILDVNKNDIGIKAHFGLGASQTWTNEYVRLIESQNSAQSDTTMAWNIGRSRYGPALSIVGGS